MCSRKERYVSSDISMKKIHLTKVILYSDYMHNVYDLLKSFSLIVSVPVIVPQLLNHL